DRLADAVVARLELLDVGRTARPNQLGHAERVDARLRILAGDTGRATGARARDRLTGDADHLEQGARTRIEEGGAGPNQRVDERVRAAASRRARRSVALGPAGLLEERHQLAEHERHALPFPDDLLRLLEKGAGSSVRKQQVLDELPRLDLRQRAEVDV